MVYDAGIVKPLIPLLLASAALAFGQSTVVLENGSVKVIKANAQPNQPSRLHEHPFNRVMIYLGAGTEDIAYEGGKTVHLSWKPGEAEWSPVSGKHVATITSPKPVTIIEVELKNTGSDAKAGAPLDPVKVDPKHYRVEFENKQVRVLRARLGPKESAPLHERALNRVVTYLTPQNIRVTEADGKNSIVQHQRGDVSWSPPAKHFETNLNDEPFEVVVVELK